MATSTLSSRREEFDLTAVSGDLGEQLIETLRHAALNGTIEVKHDQVAARTGNVYIENECLHADGQWHPSGTRVTTSDTWAIVISPSDEHARAGDVIMITLPTWLLKATLNDMASRKDRALSLKSCDYGSNPTKGAVVKLGALLDAARRRLFNSPPRDVSAAA